jgi:hypothetical protein
VFVSFLPFAEERIYNISIVKFRTKILVAIYDIILDIFAVLIFCKCLSKRKGQQRFHVYSLSQSWGKMFPYLLLG